MANWYGTSRTNYFKVEDETKFRAGMKEFDVRVIDGGDTFGLVAETEDGSWPSVDFRCTETEEGNDSPDYPDIWFPEIVAEYLADGEVAILQTVGAEKTRYVTGNSVAIDNTGKHVLVDIDHIYKMAFDAFGVKPSEAQY